MDKNKIKYITKSLKKLEQAITDIVQIFGCKLYANNGFETAFIFSDYKNELSLQIDPIQFVFEDASDISIETITKIKEIITKALIDFVPAKDLVVKIGTYSNRQLPYLTPAGQSLHMVANTYIKSTSFTVKDLPVHFEPDFFKNIYDYTTLTDTYCFDYDHMDRVLIIETFDDYFASKDEINKLRKEVPFVDEIYALLSNELIHNYINN
jgi:hypothetical protein